VKTSYQKYNHLNKESKEIERVLGTYQ